MREVYIDDLCVAEESRGQGVGEALLLHVMEKAKERGCYEISLNIWEGNEGAERFYERMGFRKRQKALELLL